MSEVVIIFTSKSLQEIDDQGGSGWWKLDAVRVRAAGKIILTHNSRDPRRPGDPDRHGKPFVLATVRDCIKAPDGRWLVQFDDFAEVSSEVWRWPGFRNPVTYADEDEVLGNLDVGPWQGMPDVSFEQALEARRRWDGQMATGSEMNGGSYSFGEIIEAHRAKLASALGVEVTQVKITIES